MTDLFTNLAAQTLGTALLIEPRVPAQLAAAPFVSEPALAITDHDLSFEQEAQPSSDWPRSLLHLPASHPQPDRTSAPREVNTSAIRPMQLGESPSLTQSWLAERQTNPAITDRVSAQTEGESPVPEHTAARLAIDQTVENIYQKPAPRAVSEGSSKQLAASAYERAADPRSTSTTQSAPDEPHQVRSSDRQAVTAHESPTWLIPLQRSSDMTRRRVDAYTIEERIVQARSDSSAIEAMVARTQTSTENTTVRPRVDQAHHFPIDHEDHVGTQPHPILFSLIAQPESTRRAHVLVQPRVEPTPETPGPNATLARHLANDKSARPTIRVSIGRVEVRGGQSTTPIPTRPRLTSSRPRLSLNDYLRQRRGTP